MLSLVSRWMGRLRGSASYLNAAAQFATVVTLLLLGLQLHLDARQRRVAVSLDYAKQFHEEEMARSRTALFRPWLRYGAELQRLSETGPVSRDFLDQWANSIVEASAEKEPAEDLRLAIYHMLDFFDRVQICVEAGLCDATTAKLYFRPFATQFYCLYQGPITQLVRQMNLRDTGEGLVRFVEGRGACG